MVHMPTPEEFAALQQALAQAVQRQDALAEQLRVASGALQATAGELRVTRTERGLLQEQLNRFKWQLFAAKSEAGATHQKDMFFNEAESLGVQAQAATEEADEDKIECCTPASAAARC